MSLAERIIGSYFGVTEGELTISDLPVSRIARDFGTPLFIYDASTLERKYSMLRRALPERVEIFYSVKANPSPAILKLFLSLGAGLEIASGGELYIAMGAGSPPERIVFAGPGKSDAEIREFFACGGGEIHVESVGEARRIVEHCESLDRKVSAAVRVNPSSEAQGGAMRMGGKSAPFGVDEEEMAGVVEVLLASPRIHVSGVHIFAGTQILDAEILAAQYRKSIELAKRVAIQVGRPIQTIDFGGGLGIPYFEGDSELDLEAYGRAVGAIVESLEEGVLGRPRLMVEPGRYLVGEGGIYVSRVVDVKLSRGKTYAVLDGGMNHHLAASGNLGQVIKRNFPIAVLNRLDEGQRQTVDVVGPLCTPLDLLARNASLPPLRAGDLVGIFQSGAYARSASPIGFLSHPSPPEVLVTGGQAELIRPRGTYQDLMRA